MKPQWRNDLIAKALQGNRAPRHGCTVLSMLLLVSAFVPAADAQAACEPGGGEVCDPADWLQSTEYECTPETCEYVDNNLTTNCDTRDGNYENPWCTIGEGYDHADPGDQVVVKDGVYKGFKICNIDFQPCPDPDDPEACPGGDCVNAFGIYVWRKNVHIMVKRDVIIRSENGPGGCLIDVEGDGNAFNLDSGSPIIQGFTIENGEPAIRVQRDHEPVIRGNVLKNNVDSGVYSNSDSPPLIIGNVITDNSSLSDGGGIRLLGPAHVEGNCIAGNAASDDGGGIHVEGYEVYAELDGNLIADNCATRGGGVNLDGTGASVVISRCVIDSNRATSDGVGDIHGGGIRLDTPGGDVIVSHCKITANHADASGGGIFALTTLSPVPSTPSSCTTPVSSPACDPTTCDGASKSLALSIDNTLIALNEALGVAGRGGGIWVFDTDLKLTSSTLSKNSAVTKGGGLWVHYSCATVENTILWDNVAGEGMEIGLLSASVHVDHSDVKGGTPEGGTPEIACFGTEESACWGFDEIVNVNIDPFFQDDDAPSPYDFRPVCPSPVNDQGSNGLLAADVTDVDGNGDSGEPVPLDLAGETRVCDCGCVEPAEEIVDMGAYEYQAGMILYVDQDATGPVHDGSSWCTAFLYLRDALEAASATGSCTVVNEIRIAEGMYVPDEDAAHPDGTGNREATFRLPGGVAVNGGFAGCGEPDPDARDIVEYQTTLSGDLNRNDAPDFVDNTENSYHVVTISWGCAGCSLSGVWITGGNADFLDQYGFYVYGGGIYSGPWGGTIEDCVVFGNYAWRGAGGMRTSGSTIRNCVFSGNVGGSHAGGLLIVGSTTETTVVGCDFVGNSTIGCGGGVSASDGTFLSSRFIGNLAEDPSDPMLGKGGGLNVMLGEGDDVDITNSLFAGNIASYDGGGIHAFRHGTTVYDCTVADNEAGSLGDGPGGGPDGRGGGLMYDHARPFVYNSVIWGNFAAETYGVDAWHQIFEEEGGGSSEIEYCCIQDWPGGIGIISTDPGFDIDGDDEVRVWTGVATFDPATWQTTFYDTSRSWYVDDLVKRVLNPDKTQTRQTLIVSNTSNTVTVWGDFEYLANDPADLPQYQITDYHPDPASDCIDSGDNGRIPAGVDTDLDGNDRIVNSIVDMGAYEFQHLLPLEPEPGPPACDHAEDCTGQWERAECVNGTCYVPKNRYISFVDNNTVAVALRVVMTESDYFPEATGVIGWVGEPDAAYVARVVGEPIYRVWTEPVIYLADCDIVPVATYQVNATVDGYNFTQPLELMTIARPEPKYWADVVGFLEGSTWRPPNGMVNMDDLVAAIQKFEGHPNAPHFTWVDVAVQIPEAVINFTDIQMILLAFQGAPYPYGCPLDDPCGDADNCGGRLAKTMARTPRTTAQFSVAPDAEFIQPGNLVEVDVFVDSVPDLGAYEVSLEMSGGNTGALELVSLVIDSQRQDYAFGAETVIQAVDMIGARLGSCVMNGGLAVQGPAYLGTFQFRASQDASGVFQINVRDGVHSYLNDSSANAIPSSPGSGTLIGCGVGCTDNGDCDDANDCTNDSCVGGWCVNALLPAGSSCDDELFCTATDECDANGTCVGTGDPCPRGWLCVETLDTCLPPF